MKLENWKSDFRDFGKLEKQFGKNWNKGNIGSRQMNGAKKIFT